MSVTEYGPTLKGATQAEPWPSIGGEAVVVLAVVSPETGHLTFANLRWWVNTSGSLFLAGGPRHLVVDTVREDGWVICDSGELVRVGGEILGTDCPHPLELARLKIGETGFSKWLLAAQSVVAQTGSRTAAMEMDPPWPAPVISAERLRQNDVANERIIDVRSHRLVVAPVGPGQIAAFNTEVDGIVEVSRIAGLTPMVESAAYDLDSGYIYLIDSRGRGAIVQVMPDDSLRNAGSFSFPNAEGPVRAQVRNATLYITCERRNRTLIWDLAYPEAPAYTGEYRFDSGLYWEKNPLVMVNPANGLPVRRFGSLPTLMDHGDIGITDTGTWQLTWSQAIVWALHGPEGGLTFALPDTPVLPIKVYRTGGLSTHPPQPNVLVPLVCGYELIGTISVIGDTVVVNGMNSPPVYAYVSVEMQAVDFLNRMVRSANDFASAGGGPHQTLSASISTEYADCSVGAPFAGNGVWCDNDLSIRKAHIDCPVRVKI